MQDQHEVLQDRQIGASVAIAPVYDKYRRRNEGQIPIAAIVTVIVIFNVGITCG